MIINKGDSSFSISSIVARDIVVDENYSISKWIERGQSIGVPAINVEGLGDPGDGNYEVRNNAILIKKFKPNVWLVRDPRKLSGDNNCAAVCDRARDTRITVKGLSQNSSIFNSFYKDVTTTGGNVNELQMKGLCFYPYITGGNAGSRVHIFFGSIIYWENTIYLSDGTSQSGNLFDLVVYDGQRFEGGWRFDGGDHNQRGIFYNCIDRLIFPDEIVGWTNFNGASYYWGFGLYTGNADVVDKNGYIDVSENPIEVIISPKGSDLSSKEIWNAYLGNESISIKEKTIDNCYKKYGYVFPADYIYRKSSLSYDSLKVDWLDATRFKISHIDSSETIIIKTPTVEYVGVSSIEADFKAFKVKVYNKPSDVNITVKRQVTGPLQNAVNNYEEELLDEISFEAALETIYYDSNNEQATGDITYTDIIISIFSETPQNLNLIFEIIPVYGETYQMNPSMYLPYTKFTIPVATDLSDGYENGTYDINKDTIRKFRWHCNTYNTDFWNIVKDYYDNNIVPTLGDLFSDSKGLDSIKLKLSEYPNQVCSQAFQYSDIKRITFDTDTNSSNTQNASEDIDTAPGGKITSANHCFARCTELEEVNITLKEGQDALINANDCSAIFEQCGKIETYPDTLINWKAYTNVLQETVPATLMSYAFDHCSSLTEIPSFPGTDIENTIVPARYAECMFRYCKSLTDIGPKIDMKLCVPSSCNGIFVGCNSLTNVSLHNLNHGDWNFDGVERNGLLHGNFTNLSKESWNILMQNLADLTTHNENVHVDTIDKSFKNWKTAYWNATYTDADPDIYFDSIRSFVVKKRVNDNAPTIVSTTEVLDHMHITVKNMQAGDKLLAYGQGDSKTIEANGSFAISNPTAGVEQGFKFLSTNTTSTEPVRVIIENGLDYTNPIVDGACLYLPSEASSYVTSEHIAAAKAKNWKVYFGGVEQ